MRNSRSRMAIQRQRTTAQASDRAQKILKLFGEGHTVSKAAEMIGISPSTASNDLRKALAMLGKSGLRDWMGNSHKIHDHDESIQQYAYELAVQGRSYAQIGEELGVHRKIAWRLVEREIATRTIPLAAHARLVELSRLDLALAKAVEILGKGNDEMALKAIDRINALGKRRADLLGLDMPAKLEIHEVSETDLEIRDMVNSARAKMAADEERRRTAVAEPAAPE